jgi:hypothetical protein
MSTCSPPQKQKKRKKNICPKLKPRIFPDFVFSVLVPDEAQGHALQIKHLEKMWIFNPKHLEKYRTIMKPCNHLERMWKECCKLCFTIFVGDICSSQTPPKHMGSQRSFLTIHI